MDIRTLATMQKTYSDGIRVFKTTFKLIYRMMIKSVFKYYLIIIGLVFCLVLILPIFRFVGITSSNSLITIKLIILMGYLYIGFRIAYLLIQFYYKKVLVLRSSFNWSISVLNWVTGVFITVGQSDSIFGSFNANLIMGFGCIIAGFIHLPRFIKLDNDSITIYEANNKRIEYRDFINIDYKDNILSFDTKLGNYNFKMIGVDSDKIDKIREVIKLSKGVE